MMVTCNAEMAEYILQVRRDMVLDWLDRGDTTPKDIADMRRLADMYSYFELPELTPPDVYDMIPF